MAAVSGPFEVRVLEAFPSFDSREDPEYLVNAFFEDDRRPLVYWDVEMVLGLLQWTRQDLMRALATVALEQPHQAQVSEEKGSILSVVERVAFAENWFWGQLGLGLERATLPGSPLERLKAVRANTRYGLVQLAGRAEITEDSGELWSGRKVVRRTLWHERDHTEQVARLLFGPRD